MIIIIISSQKHGVFRGGAGEKSKRNKPAKPKKEKRKKKNKAPEKTLLSCKDHDGPGDQICASVAGR